MSKHTGKAHMFNYVWASRIVLFDTYVFNI